MSTPRFLRLSSAVLAVLLLPFLGVPLKAKADAVTIIPPKFELFGNPGDTVSEKLKVRNDGSTDVNYQVQIEDFKAQGDTGDIDLVEGDVPATTYSLARWMTAEPSSFTVPAGQEKIVNFSIKIPKGGEPGGHYASVLIKRAGQDTPGGASVESRVGSLILLRVSGNVVEKATLDSFRVKDPYAQYGPVDFQMHFSNQGNVHVAPTGTIVITNMFGHKVREIPFTPANVLPGASRALTATWDTKNLVGKYTATLVTNYGQQKQTLSGSTTFVIFPIWLMLVIIGLIVALYLLVTKRKSIKRLINNLTSD